MARRENQGMQIAMILFIITTLAFMLSTYFAYSSATRLAGENENLQSQLDTAKGSSRSAEQLAVNLKTKIGLDPAMADDEVNQQVDQAVAKNAFSPENQTFIGIIDELNKRVTDLSGNLATANQQNQKLRKEMQDAIKLGEQKLADARANEEKAQADFQVAVKEKEDYFAKNESVNAKYLADANNAKAERTKAVREAEDKAKDALAKLDNAKEIIKIKQRENEKYINDTPDQYDGRVLGVVAATKTVLINRGSADGLRPKMVFGIFDADDTNARTAKKKASIEVTRVLGEHTAEGRITQTDYIHPIVRNDFISSPTWSPGESLGVALVGKMDFDKDGLDDRDYIRNLITLGGGRIDAEQVDGAITGSLTVNTRYIVVGDGNVSIKGADGLLQQADDLAVERMSVSELLDLMGFAGRSRAVTYDGTLRAGDFAPKSEGVRRSTPNSTKFRSRKPLPRRSTPRY